MHIDIWICIFASLHKQQLIILVVTLYSCKLAFDVRQELVYHRRYIMLALDVQLPTTTSSQHSTVMSINLLGQFPVFSYLKANWLSHNIATIYSVPCCSCYQIYLRVTSTTESCSEERRQKRKNCKIRHILQSNARRRILFYKEISLQLFYSNQDFVHKQKIKLVRC